jgi:hypothetical protein
MRCDEFIHRLNKQLDRGQPPLGDDLTEHLASCHACHRLWSTFHDCADFLRSQTPCPSADFTDEVISKAATFRDLRQRQQTTVWCSFVATIAAGLILVASIFAWQGTSAGRNDVPTPPSFTSASLGYPQHDSPRSAATDADLGELFDDQHGWNEWYDVARQLPKVHEMWTETWRGAESNSPRAASVTSSLRPVAATMSSAIRVISQRILSTYRTPPTDDGQSAGILPPATLV